MDTLKKLFPLSFKKPESVGKLVIAVLLYLLVGVVAAVVIALAGVITGWIPVVGVVIGWLLRILGMLVDVYVVVGIVFLFLHYFDVIK